MCIKNRTATLWILTETKDKYYPSQQIKSLDIILPDNNVTIHHSRYYTLIYRTQQKRPPHKKSEGQSGKQACKKSEQPLTRASISKKHAGSPESKLQLDRYTFSPILPILPKPPERPSFRPGNSHAATAGVHQMLNLRWNSNFFSKHLVGSKKLPTFALAFRGSPHRKAPRAEARWYPPKIFFKKIWWIQKLAVTLQMLSGSKKSPGAEENIERLTIDKSSTRAR